MTEQGHFYTDEHILSEAVRQLKLKGVLITTCQEADMIQALDPAQLEYATENGFIFITCDKHFLMIDHQWKEAGKEHCGIVFINPVSCQSVGDIVREILFLDLCIQKGAAQIADDLYNKVWRI
jgi:Domain of unknown function (DUF5615)